MRYIKYLNHRFVTAKILQPTLFLLCIVTIVLFGKSVITDAGEKSEAYPHVYDNAGLLSTEEAKELEEMCITYGKEAGIEILILTHDDPNAKEPEVYLEDFNDTLPEADRILLLVDMQERFLWMQGYGLAETYIHSQRIDAIYEEIKEIMADGNYFEAFETYIKRAADYMKDDTTLNWDHDYSVSTPKSGDEYYDTYNQGSNETDNWIITWWFQLIVSLIIGGIAVGIMAYHSGGKMTAGSNTYLDHDQSGLIGRRDQYLHTRVTRVRKPKDNNTSNRSGFNSGGFRGGVSSKGRSHSSGGGRF